MNHRSSSDYEQHAQFATWVKEKPSTISSTSPRNRMIANPSNSSDLHSIPTALTVTPSGERITCALKNLDDSTNPFVHPTFINDSKLDIFLPKSPSKHKKNRLQNRRRSQNNERRQVNRIILSQKLLTSRRHPKCAAVQTEESMSLIPFPEDIGDGSSVKSFTDLKATTSQEVVSFCSKTKKQCKYLSENLRKFLSFLLMVILIFWVSSVILEVEVPGEFFRIALNYFRSFKSIFCKQEEQLTLIQKWFIFIQELLL